MEGQAIYNLSTHADMDAVELIAARLRKRGHQVEVRHAGHPGLGVWFFCVDEEIVATAQSRHEFVEAVVGWLTEEGHRLLPDPGAEK